MSNYDKYPRIKAIDSKPCDSDWPAIRTRLQQACPKGILVIDTYPGVSDEEVIPEIQKLQPDCFIDMKTVFKDEKTLNEQLQYNLTADRVFGVMYYGVLTDLIDQDKLRHVQESLPADGLTIIYGFGASLVSRGNLLVYLDMARWQIQLRYRQGMPNYNCTNYNEDTLRKIKRGYFIEWRLADKHKMTVFDKVDYFIDTNTAGHPKMVSGPSLRANLKAVTGRPFRTVPYFDPGVWGGQWMKKVCGLDPQAQNYAWSFDGVPEENALYFDYGSACLEIPAMDLVLYQPKELLGEKNYARFGAEFPIRFDFLDTIDGQNLSLQVHPVSEYIKKQFGMPYTQDESYYILDAKDDACVYLGLKEGVSEEEMFADLTAANSGGQPFDADRYINKFAAHKHDHFLIPAGTCHCSGKDAMVLEISATPYIFTFKLWDWGRLGLDGRPRPVHLQHGRNVIQWDRTTAWVKDKLVNQTRTVTENEHYKEEHTGLADLEFIETRRYWINDEVTIDNANSFNIANLVEGASALIRNPEKAFADFEVHYAETFIIPAAVKGYQVINTGKQPIGLIRAYVRS